MKRFLRYGLMALCLLTLCYSGWKLYSSYLEYKAGDDIYNALAEMVSPPGEEEIDIPDLIPDPEEESSHEEDSEEREPWYLADMEELLEINSDVVGWIRIIDSNINYPLLQAENNKAYLRTTITGEYNKCGCLFVDYRTEHPFKDAMTLIYGHNLLNDKMFGDLMKYEKSDWLKTHGYIFVQTLDNEVLVYQVYSCYRTTSNSDTYTTTLETGTESYSAYLNYTIENSQFVSELVPTNEDTIITLSTCTNTTSTGRFVVHGVLLGDVNEMEF